ncbi:pantoate--beta-alanine ligase [Membranihabitans marinus]|uniref:Pantothenate synthetase n=1 Tax=Nesterenkonia rhizosphaerae TaxID=1348272 RepID=A0ABP9FZK5_9MICC
MRKATSQRSNRGPKRDYTVRVRKPQVFTTVQDFRAALAEFVRRHSTLRPTVGMVPTMGALHSGHGALVAAAREQADIVIASIFVNPLQFDDETDYQHYPRSLDADLQLLGEQGVDLVFAPTLEEMYPGFPETPQVSLTAGEMGRLWEGASRPGHFDGVVTVVAKLFNIMAPPSPAKLHAWFGQKDAEQLAIITRMVQDLNLPVTVRSLPIVRDENGLALSSRNQRLSVEDYEAALAIPQSLFGLRQNVENGDPLGLDDAVAVLNEAYGVDLDYLVVVDPATLQELPPEDGPLQQEALAMIAARVGPVRLIDNMVLTPASAASDTAR